MRLVVTFGYNKVLFSKDCDYSKVIEAIGSAMMVDESGPHDCRVYVPAEKSIDIELIPDDSIRLPAEKRPVDIEKMLELAKERDELRTKVYKLETELKKVKDVFAEPATA